MINYLNHTKEKEIRMINEKSKKHGHINGLKKSSKETFNLYVTKKSETTHFIYSSW